MSLISSKLCTLKWLSNLLSHFRSFYTKAVPWGWFLGLFLVLVHSWINLQTIWELILKIQLREPHYSITQRLLLLHYVISCHIFSLDLNVYNINEQWWTPCNCKNTNLVHEGPLSLLWISVNDQTACLFCCLLLFKRVLCWSLATACDVCGWKP